MNGKYDSIGRQSLKNQNLFLNLSDLDACVVSSPAEPKQTKLSNNCYFTEWDHWVIKEGEGTTTLEEVLNELQLRSGSNCTMLVMDSKSIYLPELFPHHLKRKKQTMRDIISNYYSEVPSFVGLSVSFESEDDEISGPNIKYIFTQNDN